MCSVARRDKQTFVVFLTTREDKPNEYKWIEIKIILKYLKVTIHMKLKLMMDTLFFLNCLVDDLCNTGEGCREHTGDIVSLVKD